MGRAPEDSTIDGDMKLLRMAYLCCCVSCFVDAGVTFEETTPAVSL